jgi:hypothetical protein
MSPLVVLEKASGRGGGARVSLSNVMSRMTLKEKVGHLNLTCFYLDELGKDIPSKLEACRRFAAGCRAHWPSALLNTAF